MAGNPDDPAGRCRRSGPALTPTSRSKSTSLNGGNSELVPASMLLVQFDANTKNVVLTITNTSAKEIRFELKPFLWNQAPPDGTMELTPTSDIVIFPPLVTMKPHAVQRVRVGTTAVPGPVEKAYRVMAEEGPSGDAPAGATTVAVRTRVGMPVFIAPTQSTLISRIDSVRFDKRAVSIALAVR